MTLFIEYDLPTSREQQHDLEALHERFRTRHFRKDTRIPLEHPSLHICKVGDEFVMSLLGGTKGRSYCYTLADTSWRYLIRRAEKELCSNFKAS